MNKGQLIDKIATDADLSKAQATAALNSFMDAVKGTLSAKEKVTLVGFGTFSVSERAARMGRNPRTGAEIPIPARVIAKFKAGKELEAAVNS